MFKKVTVWKVVLTLVILAALAVGGAMLYKAGYMRGVASNLDFPKYHQMGMDEDYKKAIPFDKYPFYKTPFVKHPWVYKSFPRMSPGLFCFGGLIFFVLVTGLGIYLNRLWVYRKHGPSDLWHFWAPPQSPEEKADQGKKSKKKHVDPVEPVE
jgi:hypothetical protein